MRALLRLVLGLGLVAGGVGPAPGQTVIAAGPDAAASRLLEAPARLEVRNTTLTMALMRLSETSGVVVAFSPTLLDGDGRRVDCACRASTVAQALDHLLAGTMFGYSVRDGQVILTPAVLPLPNVLESRPRAAVASLSMLPLDAYPRVPAAAPAPLQEGTVAGTVVEESGRQPVAGAQVAVAGTNRGTLTDSRGQFRITGLTGAQVTLEVVHIGYRKLSQSVRVGDMSVRLAVSASAINLDEVVVTGTPGAAQKRSLGNSVARVNAAQVAQVAPVRSVGDLLNGRAPGVVVMPGAGVVGSGPRISIRGRGSLSLRAEPLIYIDGVRVSNDVATGPSTVQGAPSISRLADLSPDQIESIEIIKGPSATTLYGTEAANGVIQILTKKGVQGAPLYSLSIKQGANWFMNPEGTISRTYRRNAAGELLEGNVFEQEKRLGKPLFSTGHLQGYLLDASGGNDLVRFYGAGSFDREEGVEPTNVLKRMTGRLNVNVTPSSKLDFSATAGIVQQRVDLNLQEGLSLIRNVTVYDPSQANTPARGFEIPPEAIWAAFKQHQQVQRYTVGSAVNHRPTEWFSHRLNVGIDQTTEDNHAYNPLTPDSIRRFVPFATARDGQKVVERRLLTVNTFDYSGTVRLNLPRGIGSATAFGVQYYRNFLTATAATGRGFAAEGLSLVGAAATTFATEDFVENTTVGLFGQQQLSLSDRIFLTAALRADDNSAFGGDFDLVTYPKLSAAWVISEEPFWKVGFVDALKLRAAYGQSGQQPQAFAALQTYRPIPTGAGASSVSPKSLGNPELGPERGEEVEFGFEAEFAGGRLGMDVTYYDKRTRNAILLRDLAPSTGFAGQQFINAGLVTNKGVEALLEAVPVELGALKWSLSLNVGTNANRIVDLDPANPGRTFISGLFEDRHAEGYPIGGHFKKKVVSARYDPTTRRMVDIMCDGGQGRNGVEPGGSPVPCAGAPRLYLGQSTPKYQGAVINTLTLGERISLHAQVDFKGGHRIRNFTQQSRCITRGLCKESPGNAPGEVDPVLAAETQLGGDNVTIGSSFISPATFAKLRELSLSYALPSAWTRRVGAGRGRITVAGRNLHTWTDYSGYDPENTRLQLIDSSQQSYRDQYTLPHLASFQTSITLNW